MQRTQIYLSDYQRREIFRLASEAGVSQASVIRRILDEALGADDGAAERLAAVEATAGICRDYPDWPEWLASVRGRDGEARLRDLGL